MDREVFLSALSTLPNGSEMVQFFEDSIKAETSKGVSSSHRANSENVKYKKAFQKLGWDGTADLDEFTGVVLDTIEGNKTSGNAELSDLNAQVRKLQKAFDISQNELKAEREQRETLQRQNKIKTIEGKVLPRLSNDINGAQWIVKSLLSEGSLDMDENGDIIIKNGDSVLGFEDGLTHIINSNPDLKKSKQVPGVGTSSSTGNKVTTGKPKYTLEQLKTMSPEQAAADLTGYNESMKHYSNK